MAEPSFEGRPDVSNVAWSDVVHFIRQLSHDLRNHLNAFELQAPYISELERDAAIKIDNKRFLFTLEEPKGRFDLPTDDWGREPLHKISQGHYGLGLNRVRAIVEAHGGELYAQHDPEHSTLITRLSLPLEGERRISGC